MTTAIVIALALLGYLLAGFWVASALGRRIRRLRLAREAWHEAYWAARSEAGADDFPELAVGDEP